MKHTFLAADPVSAGLARQFVSTTLSGWRSEHLIDTAALLISELVTNAVIHAGSAIELCMAQEADAIRFEVHDRSGCMPSPRRTAPGDTCGRGLMLVAALSRAWGVDARGPGKAVWFTLTT